MYVLVRQRKVAFAADPLNRSAVQVVVLFVPRDGLVEVARSLLLLAPQTGANQTYAIDDDEIGVGPRSQFVIQLEGDVIGMVGVKDLPERHRTGLLRTGGDDMAVLGIPAGIVVDFCARIECHPLEALVDAMSSSSTLYDTESES